MSYNLKNIKQEFKDKGIFYTPPNLVEILHSYIDIKPKTVYDPTCGDGALLSGFGDDVVKYGQEINDHQLHVAKERLTNFNGYCGDTLKDPHFKDMKFDCILANPPFSVKWEPKWDERFEGTPTLAPPSKADYAFILHILHYLRDDGMAVVLNFPGIAYRGQREGAIRKWIVQQNYVERVVHIPGDTFVDTKIATILLILKKNKETTDIIFEDKENNIIKTVKFDEIEKNDFNLSVSTYIQKETEKESVDPLELQRLAMSGFYKKIRAELNFTKQVCQFENIPFEPYLEEIKKILKEYE